MAALPAPVSLRAADTLESLDDSAVSKSRLCYSCQNCRKCSASMPVAVNLDASAVSRTMAGLMMTIYRKEQKQITPVDDPELQAWLTDKSLPQQRVSDCQVDQLSCKGFTTQVYTPR